MSCNQIKLVKSNKLFIPDPGSMILDSKTSTKERGKKIANCFSWSSAPDPEKHIPDPGSSE
jgi:hypothetical protein